ncbi:hypothetical protein G6F40_015463 [Rhizopus arrhizus]|nr:hypothetical protein G6F40_015463 [Rhizopus arrhizus]
MTLPTRSARSCRSKHRKRLAAARPASSTLLGSAMPLPGADFPLPAGHHQVHVARGGHQRQGRRPAGALHVGFGQQFQVVDRGAGTLGHARHGRCLRPPAGVLGHVDDPVGQYAAALAAYKNGVGSLTDATLAQSQMLIAQNAYADSIANARSAAAVLAVATGRVSLLDER